VNRILPAVCLAAALCPAAPEPPLRTLSVTGTAEVKVAPDICFMTLVVSAENKQNAARAYGDNNAAAQRIADAIRGQGIGSEDIQTSGFSISPQYRYEDRTRRRIFEGYSVRHTLAVKVRDLTHVSSVLDAAVGAGATEVNSVNFTIENPKRYLADARIEAIRAARAKAEAMAEAAGVQVSRPLTITEYEPSGWGRFAQSNVEIDRTGAEVQFGASLEPGQVALSHTVSITYEIR